jgi:hypothetical protein
VSNLCEITPISAFMSTNLNSKIECFQQLGARIMRMLGHPIINVEVHPDQLYDAISMAVEFFTKYAGYTREYLIFDSNLYEPNKGLRLDHLFTVANSGFSLTQRLAPPARSNPDFTVDIPTALYVSLSAIPQSYFSGSSSLSSAVASDGIYEMQVIDKEAYDEFVNYSPVLSGLFKMSPQRKISSQCETIENAVQYNNMFDYDAMDYRKVMSVTDFEEGSTTGINTLFTLEQTLAQQTYFSYAMGNYGFDLLSWHTMKDWIDTREKLLAIRRDLHFDPRTQYLKMYPQPKNTRFYGVVSCYVEKPIRDIIKEKWVLDYSIALTKVMWGRILTKITGVSLLGGGNFSGDTILSEGNKEKEALEQLLIEGGYGDAEPIMFLMA